MGFCPLRGIYVQFFFFFFLNFHLCYFRSGLLSRCEMQVFSRIRWFDQIVVADLLAILRAGSSWRFECCL